MTHLTHHQPLWKWAGWFIEPDHQAEAFVLAQYDELMNSIRDLRGTYWPTTTADYDRIATELRRPSNA